MITEILLATEAALTGANIFSKHKASKIANLETDLRKVETQMRATQKTMRAQAKEYQVMNQQEAKNATSGFDAASPSFKAISQASFNAFLADEDMIAMNAEMQENMLDIRKSQQSRRTNQSIFATLTSFGFRALNSYPFGSKLGNKKDKLNDKATSL